ncbi:MAG: hypothetical protein Kow00109_13890 [Acidobacteriota bacterium]
MSGKEQTESYSPLREEYRRLARRYEERWRFYVEASIKETLHRLHPWESARVLDIGCGTGLLLERLREQRPESRFVGVDACGEMLQVAQERRAGNASWIVGLAEQLPFSRASFDVVLSTNVFHFIRRPSVALAEFSRVLQPGGWLYVTDWCDDYWACRICDFFLRRFSASHVRTYGTNECRNFLLRAGFDTVHVERYKISRLWGLMTAAARKPADAESPRCIHPDRLCHDRPQG